MESTIHCSVRFLIGFRWDGRMERLDPSIGEIKNPAQFCIDRLWTKIEGVGKDWYRFLVYKNRYPLVIGYGTRPKADPGPTPEWELERRRKAEEYNSPAAREARAAREAASKAAEIAE